MNSIIDLKKLSCALVCDQPFKHVIVPGFIHSSWIGEVSRDYPSVNKPGSLPLNGISYGASFANLIQALRSTQMAETVGERLGVDLHSCPTMVTIRAWCRKDDGKIHTDSRGKLVTALLYMNEEWENGNGRLRLLSQAHDIENYHVEIPPERGTLLLFLNSGTAWHGHKSFEGPRRAIQVNWVRSKRYLYREKIRHTISALLKSNKKYTP